MQASGVGASGSRNAVPADRVEIAAFLDALTMERETFKTSTAQVLRSEILVVEKEGDRIVGVAGLKTMWGAPTVYVVVSNPHQGKQHGHRLVDAVVERARSEHPFLLAIVMNQNDTAIRILRRLGFKASLANYKCHFLFLPISRWSYLLYPLYAAFFPVWYWGFFLVSVRRPAPDG